MYFKLRKYLSRLSHGRISPLEVSAWIKRLGPSFKDSLIPFSLSCIFLYHQIKVDELFLRVTANFWIPTWHVF